MKKQKYLYEWHMVLRKPCCAKLQNDAKSNVVLVYNFVKMNIQERSMKWHEQNLYKGSHPDM